MKTEKEIETVPEPIKITKKKQPITEKQKFTLQKAREAKSKKKAEQPKKTPFVLPTQYMIATLGIGCIGLGAYYFLNQRKNSPIIQQHSERVVPQIKTSQPTQEPIAPPIQEPIVEEKILPDEYFK